MFVKVVRKNLKNKHPYGGTTIYECSKVQCFEVPEKELGSEVNSRLNILLEPTNINKSDYISLDVNYNKKGQTDTDVYLMNNEGKTIDKLTGNF